MNNTQALAKIIIKQHQITLISTHLNALVIGVRGDASDLEFAQFHQGVDELTGQGFPIEIRSLKTSRSIVATVGIKSTIELVPTQLVQNKTSCCQPEPESVIAN